MNLLTLTTEGEILFQKTFKHYILYILGGINFKDKKKKEKPAEKS